MPGRVQANRALNRLSDQPAGACVVGPIGRDHKWQHRLVLVFGRWMGDRGAIVGGGVSADVSRAASFPFPPPAGSAFHASTADRL
jgi:hypothetical protein